MQTQPRKKRFHYAWVILLCGCALYGTSLGLGYTIGNFYLPVSSALGVGVGVITLAKSAGGWASALFLPTARKIVTKYNIRVVLTVSTLVTSGCYVLMGMATNVYQFFFIYALNGLATACYGGVTTAILINNWFRKKAGFAYGICIATSSLFGAVLSPLLAMVINSYSWRAGYLLNAAILAVVLLPFTVFLVHRSPEDIGLLPYGDDGESTAKAAESAPGEKAAAAPGKSGVPVARAARTPPFIALMIIAPCFGCLIGMTAHFTAYSTAMLGAIVASLLTSVALVGSTVGKVTMGILNDKFGVKTPLFLSQSCVIGGLCLVILSAFVGSATLPVLIVGVVIYGFGSSAAALLNNFVTKESFGMLDFDKFFSYVTMAQSIMASMIGPIFGFIFDVTGTYIPTFILAICISATGLVCARFALSRGGRMRAEFGDPPVLRKGILATISERLHNHRDVEKRAI